MTAYAGTIYAVPKETKSKNAMDTLYPGCTVILALSAEGHLLKTTIRTENPCQFVAHLMNHTEHRGCGPTPM